MSEQSSLIRVFCSMNYRLANYYLFIAVTSLLMTTNSYAQTPLAIGSSLPLGSVGMEDVSGRSFSLNDISDRNGLLVIFASNTCPWIQRMESRINELSEFTDENDIGMVALNPNEGYRERGDNLEEMVKHADKSDYQFPYLLDESHQIADAFGASRTPEVFLFNGDMELVYSGAIDDNANNANGVQRSYTRQAIDAILTDTETQPTRSRPVGCSIKRGS